MRLSDLIKAGAKKHPQTRANLYTVTKEPTAITLGKRRGYQEVIAATCAMGAASVAISEEEVNALLMKLNSTNVDYVDPTLSSEARRASRAGYALTLAEQYGGMTYTHPCPECGESPDILGATGGPVRTASQMIIHLNDDHGWTRERIAEWLVLEVEKPFFDKHPELDPGKGE